MKIVLNKLGLSVGLFFTILISALFLFKSSEPKAQSVVTATLPTSGTCSLLITLPVPLGVDVNMLGETGYSLLGQITFLNENQAVLNGVIGNVVFKTNNSPEVAAPEYLKDIPVTITPMNNSNGFLGGYILNAIGTPVGGAKTFNLNINSIPANGGRTILMQLAGPSVGPGSGVCQFL